MSATSAWRLLVGSGLAAAIVVGIGSSTVAVPWPQHAGNSRERRTPTPEELQPSVEAAFEADDYAPRTVATLRLFDDAPGVELRVFHAGPEHARTLSRNVMHGLVVEGPFAIGDANPGQDVRVPVGAWPSGLYFARLDSTDGRVGFAPFVVDPSRLGEHRVAVVLPTFTWQAYNIRDDDGDGVGDSWYADWNYHFARLYRPFLDRGVPFNFKSYDLRFLHWLARTGKQVDFLSDEDLDRMSSADDLARAYDLIVFPGHHEYVTTHEYDLVEGYRDLGGNLMFLSANDFFWQVVRLGPVLERTAEWRDLGRPEASLIGVQYATNAQAFGRYVVRDPDSEPWLFAGTGLHRGSVFGHGGIEIDSVAPSSPPDVHVVASIPDVFGRGRTAEMTVYHTRLGGTVFAAGSFTLAGSAESPDVSRVLENLWAYMTQRH